MIRRWLVVALCAVLTASQAVSSAPPVSAQAQTSSMPRGVVVTRQALRWPVDAAGPVDSVRVSRAGLLDSATEELAHRAAVLAGAASENIRTGMFPVAAVRRGGAVVQAARAGWAYPVSFLVASPDVAVPLMDRRVGGTLTWRGVVLSRTAARLREAQVGDQLMVVRPDGGQVPLVVGAIVDDAVTGGTEVIMSPETARSVDVIRSSQVVIWAPRSRAALEAALREVGLVGRRETSVRRSWDPPDPDAALSLAEVKVALGEFAYRVSDSGAVSIDPTWVDENITGGGIRGRFDDIGVRAACHVKVWADLQRAISAVAAAGLAEAIDLATTNRYGGCYVARFNRIGGGIVGTLSRHSWGMALDVNTTTNVQGAEPTLDCRVVRIFREHGFSWGGNYTRPDGMHFEWVGEPRHELVYPSRFCPNTPE